MAILTALLGSYGQPGGIYLPTKIPIPKFPSPPYPKPNPRADGAGTIYPLASRHFGITNGLVAATFDEKPYPIKGWIIYGQNVIQSIPDPEKTKKAIEKLDLMVVVDVMPTEQMNYADLVLPESTYLERYDDLLAVKNAKTPFVAIRQPVIEPIFDTKPGWWIAKELSKRIDLGDYFQWETIEEYLDHRLSGLGVKLDEVRAKGIVPYDEAKPYFEVDQPINFKTPTGKIELYSTTLEKLGFDPIPIYEPTQEVPQNYFRLLYGRSPLHSFARTQNNEILNNYMPENVVWINDRISEKLGLIDGEKIVLENQDGIKSDPIAIYVTPGIGHDSVFMVHGFGERNSLLKRANRKGTSDTYLMSRYEVDQISGGTGMRVNFVRLIKNGVALAISGGFLTPEEIRKPHNEKPKPDQKKKIEIEVHHDDDEGC